MCRCGRRGDRVAGKLPAEGDVGVVEKLLAAPQLSELRRTAQIDAVRCPSLLDVDDGDRVIQRIGDKRRVAVGRNQDAARAGRRGIRVTTYSTALPRWFGSPAAAARRSRKSGCRSACPHRRRPRRPACSSCHRPLPVRRDGDVGGIGEAEARLIQQQLIGTAVSPDHA